MGVGLAILTRLLQRRGSPICSRLVDAPRHNAPHLRALLTSGQVVIQRRPCGDTDFWVRITAENMALCCPIQKCMSENSVFRFFFCVRVLLLGCSEQRFPSTDCVFVASGVTCEWSCRPGAITGRCTCMEDFQSGTQPCLLYQSPFFLGRASNRSVGQGVLRSQTKIGYMLYTRRLSTTLIGVTLPAADIAGMSDL